MNPSALGTVAARARRLAYRVALAVLVCAPLALVALPARELADAHRRVDALREQVAQARTGQLSAAELAQVGAAVAALEGRLSARGESGLARRVLVEVFARDAGVELTAIDAVTGTLADGTELVEVRGSATMPAWVDWIAALAGHGLAPRVEHYRLARAHAAESSFDGVFTLAFARSASEARR
jgi:hypothetical protein